MSVDLDIQGISNLSKLLERLPLGEPTRALFQRLGVWNTSAHDGAAARVRPFEANMAQLSDDDLSANYGRWSSELMRVHELCGLLDGQRRLLDLEAKRARAQARSRIRAEYEAELEAARAEEPPRKVTKPTSVEINDRAEDDEVVAAADRALVMLDVVLIGVQAYREGCTTAVTSLSREISFRQAQFSARVRA